MGLSGFRSRAASRLLFRERTMAIELSGVVLVLACSLLLLVG